MRQSLFIISILISCLFSQAASSDYVLSGRISEDSGEPISYATITVKGGLDGKDRVFVPEADGSFNIKLPSGKYDLLITALGFSSFNEKITLDKDVFLEIRMKEEATQLKGIEVYGKSYSRKLEEGAFSVNAVEITPNINRMVTLNDLVDRTAGVKVRREGGVGSDFDLTINGMSGNSIRYFIDGVPLETKGSGMTLDNIPLNTVERIELYKGVVPTYLSSDALGGAVNVVTKKQRQNFLDASYGIGSFHTHSGDVTGQVYIPGTAIVIRPTFSINYSKNDYIMKDVEVWSDEEDRYITADMHRFHDDYLSVFAQVEAGVQDVKWADRFFVGVSYNKTGKDIQTGAMQNKVYGMAEKNSRSFNMSARYNKRWNALSTRISLSHTWDHSETVDTAYRKYSWDGTYLSASGNEIRGKARSIRVYKRPLTVLNAGLDYELNEHNVFSLDYMLNRCGNDRSDNVDETFEPSNDVVSKHIISFTYMQSFFNQKMQASYFLKDYINDLSVEQTDDSTITGSSDIESNSTKNYWGAGLGLRYAFCEPASVKGSFEHSVRLPLSRELLGNGTTVYPNLALVPETSNNVNLGFFGSWFFGNTNQISYEVNGFIRHVQNYIRATISERDGMMQYVNEPAIDIKGFDFELSYFWDNRLQVLLNGSWSDARNLRKYRTDGNPSPTYKNRVPNRPWMFGNAEIAYTFRDLALKTDRLRIGVEYQYIHWFFLNWEAYGAIETKAKIPTQNITNVSLSYSWRNQRYNVSMECDNVFDRRAYDNYMLQKPGRSFSAKFRLYIN